MCRAVCSGAPACAGTIATVQAAELHTLCRRSRRHRRAETGGALHLGGFYPSERLLFIMKNFQPPPTWTTPSYAWYAARPRSKGARSCAGSGDPAASSWRASRAAPFCHACSHRRSAVEAPTLRFLRHLRHLRSDARALCPVRDGLHLAEDQILNRSDRPSGRRPLQGIRQARWFDDPGARRARHDPLRSPGDIVSAMR